MGLRSFVNSEKAPVVVAQRLKRMPTILDKLGRHSAMELTRMQDIGGCRAVFPQGGFAYIEGVRRRMRRQRWNVVEEYDYITSPKRSGYRGVHVVVLRGDRLIEIQLRTEAVWTPISACCSARKAAGDDEYDGAYSVALG